MTTQILALTGIGFDDSYEWRISIDRSDLMDLFIRHPEIDEKWCSIVDDPNLDNGTKLAYIAYMYHMIEEHNKRSERRDPPNGTLIRMGQV